jgi:hypothetical protein
MTSPVVPLSGRLKKVICLVLALSAVVASSIVFTPPPFLNDAAEAAAFSPPSRSQRAFSPKAQAKEPVPQPERQQE